MSRSATRARLLVGLSAVAILAAACTGGASPSPSAAASTAPSVAPSASAAPSAAKMYTIGFSNTGGTGNGFREEQNCTAKAEALASGQVEKVDMIARHADGNQQPPAAP